MRTCRILKSLEMEQLHHSTCNLKALVSWIEYGSSNQFRCVIMPCNIFVLDLQCQATSFGVNFISFIRAAEATPVQDKTSKTMFYNDQPRNYFLTKPYSLKFLMLLKN